MRCGLAVALSRQDVPNTIADLRRALEQLGVFFLGAVSDSVWVFVRNRDEERGRGILWLRFCPNNYLVMVELGITLMDFVFMDLSVWAVRHSWALC